MQLGLLGLIAEAGGFKDLAEAPALLEYWSLAKQDRKDRRGFVEAIGPAEHILAEARHHFSEAAARWLTGEIRPLPPSSSRGSRAMAITTS